MELGDERSYGPHSTVPVMLSSNYLRGGCRGIYHTHGRKLRLGEAGGVDQSLMSGDLGWAAHDCGPALSQIQSKTDHIPGSSASTKTPYVPVVADNGLVGSACTGVICSLLSALHGLRSPLSKTSGYHFMAGHGSGAVSQQGWLSRVCCGHGYLSQDQRTP